MLARDGHHGSQFSQPNHRTARVGTLRTDRRGRAIFLAIPECDHALEVVYSAEFSSFHGFMES